MTTCIRCNGNRFKRYLNSEVQWCPACGGTGDSVIWADIVLQRKNSPEIEKSLPPVYSEECNICGEGIINNLIDKNKVNYRGFTTELPCYYSNCDTCDSDFASGWQINLNAAIMKDFKKEIDKMLKEKNK